MAICLLQFYFVFLLANLEVQHKDLIIVLRRRKFEIMFMAVFVVEFDFIWVLLQTKHGVNILGILDFLDQVGVIGMVEEIGLDVLFILARIGSVENFQLVGPFVFVKPRFNK